ncbi:hypothetical protein ACOCJ7_13850 [Knoellia sp. CPCC 206453]|uniref:hypothetical protein n=1 Tax=Knoellia pratensis TaxID=3404796 RepID=UPI003605C204
MLLNVSDPAVAYLLGLLHTDGSHYGDVNGKGKVTIELAVRDIDVLNAVQPVIPCYSSISLRTRKTNFADNCTTATLAFFDQEVRQQLATLGMPPGRKSRTVVPPTLEPTLQVPYLRGLLDGDGSIGFTAKDCPFVSFVTDSEALVRFVEAEIFRHAHVRRRAGRNTRDGAFNVMVASVAAVDLATAVWGVPNQVGLQRKREAAARVAAWTPPTSRFGIRRKGWLPHEDPVVMALDPETAAIQLGRTVQSVNMRRWRIARAQRLVAEPHTVNVKVD